jgi:competence protein ComEA
VGRADRFYLRAGPWLLEALAGIGETRAGDIVDYHDDNGPSKRIDNLLQVRGIGEGTFDKTRYYIAVSD